MKKAFYLMIFIVVSCKPEVIKKDTVEIKSFKILSAKNSSWLKDDIEGDIDEEKSIIGVYIKKDIVLPKKLQIDILLSEDSKLIYPEDSIISQTDTLIITQAEKGNKKTYSIHFILESKSKEADIIRFGFEKSSNPNIRYDYKSEIQGTDINVLIDYPTSFVLKPRVERSLYSSIYPNNEDNIYNFETPLELKIVSEDGKNVKIYKVEVKYRYDNYEKEILQEFYKNMGGKNWKTQTNWNTDMPLYQWYGIKMNTKNEYITSIDLRKNSLKGELPSSIFELPFLEYIYLDYNQINGSLPTTAGNSKALKSLEISYNNLNGNIMEFVEGVKLKTIKLHHNELSGTIPSSIKNLDSLENLDISYNELGGEIPLEIGSLLKIKKINFQRNNFIGNIPLGVVKLPLIEELLLYSNQFIGNVPLEISEMQNKSKVYLQNNKLNDTLSTDFCNKISSKQIELITSGNPSLVGCN